MKKNLITLALLLVAAFSFAQKTDIPFEKSSIPIVDGKIVYTFIDTIPNSDKKKIYSKISEWIALNFKSAKNVVQLSDSEAGKIIVKGSLNSTFKLKTLGMMTYPYILSFTINFTVKDDKYRMIVDNFDVDQTGSYSKLDKLEDFYETVNVEYDFNKLGLTKRLKVLQAKQILNNTTLEVNTLNIKLREFLLKSSTNALKDDF